MVDPLRELETRLQRAAPTSARDVDPKSTRAVLSELAQGGVGGPIFEEIRNNSALLELIASNSYSHPNGFDKIVLASLPGGELKLVMHVWWPRPSPAEDVISDIHNHRWDFASIILTGRLAWSEYAPSESVGQLYYHYHYGAPSTGAYTMRAMGVGRLQRMLTAIFSWGTSYYLSHDLIHSAENAGTTLAATLVVEGPVQRVETDVYRIIPPATEPQVKISLTQLTASVVRDAIDQVLVALRPPAD